MAVSEEHCALFGQSLERCRQREDFLGRFYERFLASSPDIASKFSETNFQRQKAVLLLALHTLRDCARRGESATLESLATIHSRTGRNIPPWMYKVWLECLLETVRECDPLVTKHTQGAWRAVVQNGIEVMKARY